MLERGRIIYLRRFQAGRRAFWVARFQEPGRVCCGGAKHEVFKGNILRRHDHVVHRADLVVGVIPHPRPSDAIAIAKTGFQQPVESPTGLLQQTFLQVRANTFLLELFVDLQHGIGGPAGAERSLRQIAGIMPAAVDDVRLAVEGSLPVLMAHMMNAEDIKTAALAVIKVQRLLNHTKPDVVGDGERLAGGRAGA